MTDTTTMTGADMLRAAQVRAQAALGQRFTLHLPTEKKHRLAKRSVTGSIIACAVAGLKLSKTGAAVRVAFRVTVRSGNGKQFSGLVYDIPVPPTQAKQVREADWARFDALAKQVRGAAKRKEEV